MKVLIVNNSRIPALQYGGTERVIWALGKSLTAIGHKVSYMAERGSYCPFADEVLPYDNTKPFDIQVPPDVDVIHFNWTPPDLAEVKKNYIITLHGNINHPCKLNRNLVFVSKNHARRYGGNVYVHNGMDWDAYPQKQISNSSLKYFHFLANASWKVKNVKGAIRITKMVNENLSVLGGNRLNFNMGFRFTPDLHVKFYGMVDDVKKAAVLQNSKGLIFPVLWNEPFGLAIIESLFYGCPVFATPYGSLPELVTTDVGYLSDSEHSLALALKESGGYNREKCRDYAVGVFDANTMAKKYLALYEKVLNGQALHDTEPEVTEAMLQKVKYLYMKP